MRRPNWGEILGLALLVAAILYASGGLILAGTKIRRLEAELAQERAASIPAPVPPPGELPCSCEEMAEVVMVRNVIRPESCYVSVTVRDPGNAVVLSSDGAPWGPLGTTWEEMRPRWRSVYRPDDFTECGRLDAVRDAFEAKATDCEDGEGCCYEITLTHPERVTVDG